MFIFSSFCKIAVFVHGLLSWCVGPSQKTSQRIGLNFAGCCDVDMLEMRQK